MKDIAIVVVAFNRPLALKRLLHSVSQAIYSTENIPLYICIDASKDASHKEVVQLAEAFSWKLGVKTIIKQPTPLGLKDHVLICGDLVKEHEAVIVLEDDLYVSPYFYAYAQKAANFYTNEDKVAGISLFTYEYDESAFYPFEPLTDESDVHFIQVPSSWGQLWTQKQWFNFKSWLESERDNTLINLPAYAQIWGAHSWKKYAMSYLIDTGRYFVFPNTSYTANFEEKGTNSSQTGYFISKLELTAAPKTYQVFQASKSVYDAYFEMTSLCLNQWNPEVSTYDYTIDLKGQKPQEHLQTPYILTSKKGKNPIHTFAATLRPLEQNIALSLEGTDLGLYRKEDVNEGISSKKFQHYLPTAFIREVQANAQQTISFDIVIPVLQLDEKALQKSIQSIAQQSNTFDIILVCTKATFESVSAFLPTGQAGAKANQINSKVISSKHVQLTELLRDGFLQGNSRIQTWIHQGSTFTKDAFYKVAQVSTSFPTTSWWGSLDEAVPTHSYETLNTASLRWSMSVIKKIQESGQWERTQGQFFRRELLDRKSSAHEASMFVFPENTPLSIIALHLICKKKMPNKNASKRERTPGIINSIPYYFFKKNIPFVRTIYREMHHLPPVIRFDYTYNTFYLENY